MQRILTTLIVVFFIVVGGLAYSQEPPKLTPEQRIAQLERVSYDWEYKYNIEVRINSQLREALIQTEWLLKKAGGIIKKLQEELKASNAELAQLKMKPTK